MSMKHCELLVNWYGQVDLCDSVNNLIRGVRKEKPMWMCLPHFRLWIKGKDIGYPPKAKLRFLGWFRRD